MSYQEFPGHMIELFQVGELLSFAPKKGMGLSQKSELTRLLWPKCGQ